MSTNTLILRAGVIHSREHPYATALGIADGRIAWIGSEGLADVRVADDPTATVINLGESLVTPAFVDSGWRAAGHEPGPAAAYGVAYVTPAPQPGSGAGETGEPRVLNPLTEQLPLAEMQARGDWFAFGSCGAEYGPDQHPWAWVRAALLQADHPLTARAAFNAATRAGHRYAGRDLTGELETGAPATLAVFRTSALAVQTPDAVAQSWSTDVRAGTPMLPELTAGGELPKCLFTLRDGETLHAAAQFAGLAGVGA
ncbi:hypothetical protein JT358_03945 [Micrococcales bacterium 31B]|nr:hypothetical protein [Micrococcales bacterium 31B]